MLDWNMRAEDAYLRAAKWYSKKKLNEFIAVTANLDKYLAALQNVGNPLQITASFIHNEPDGIVALDQKGRKQKVKLQQTRLYIFPHLEEKTLYVLTIGDKRSQSNDINYCRKFVRKLKNKS